MKDTIKIIFIFLMLIIFLFLFTYSNEIKNFIQKIKITETILSKSDIFNLYSFLETKYENILLPKKIMFKDNKTEFICDNLIFTSNGQEIQVKIKFTPHKNKDLISKYIFLDKYGTFEFVENQSIDSDVPEIDHLSSDNSDDLNFDINEIINSEAPPISEPNTNFIPNHNINSISNENKDIFIKNVDTNDTENETTESLINNIL